ncbi:MAG: hypothetical protein KDI79_02230 [Anaerolineae bacterium]|nr:hypothetical protein [Anaerolineae bacterium]
MTNQIDNLKQSAKDGLNTLAALKRKHTLSEISANDELAEQYITAKENISKIRTELNTLAQSSLNSGMPGSYLISLMKSGLDEALTPNNYLQEIYEIAQFWLEIEPETAAELSQLALKVDESYLVIGASSDLIAKNKKVAADSIDINQLKTGRGKLYLLQAASALNFNFSRSIQPGPEIKKMLEDSINQFKATNWFQLTALAYLGLATIHENLKKIDEAEYTIGQALRYALQESVVTRVNKEGLIQAIHEQQAKIEVLKKETDEPTLNAASIDEENKVRALPLFAVSRGQGCITGHLITRLNLLSGQDYEKVKTSSPTEKVVIDPNKVKTVEDADYILEIDPKVTIGANLAQGDWLLIDTKVAPHQLHGKIVFILTKQNNKLETSLRKFSKTNDHYFLEPLDNSQPCIVLAEYETEWDRLNHYYQTPNPRFEIKRVYEVYISGEVIDHVPYSKRNEIAHSYIWQLPIVSHIAAGAGVIAREDIIDYVEVRDSDCIRPSFGAHVEGDSMSGDHILNDQIALIKKKPSVKQGEIAAIVIIAPGLAEPLGVIKRYYVIEQQNDTLRHWLLESSNPTSEHIVVTSPGSDLAKIKNIYAKRVKTGKIIMPIFYEQGEVVVVGNFVGSP